VCGYVRVCVCVVVVVYVDVGEMRVYGWKLEGGGR
jgi:hypothetical protein